MKGQRNFPFRHPSQSRRPNKLTSVKIAAWKNGAWFWVSIFHPYFLPSLHCSISVRILFFFGKETFKVIPFSNDVKYIFLCVASLIFLMPHYPLRTLSPGKHCSAGGSLLCFLGFPLAFQLLAEWWKLNVLLNCSLLQRRSTTTTTTSKLVSVLGWTRIQGRGQWFMETSSDEKSYGTVWLQLCHKTSSQHAQSKGSLRLVEHQREKATALLVYIILEKQHSHMENVSLEK